MNRLYEQKVGRGINIPELHTFLETAQTLGYDFIEYSEAPNSARFIIMRHDIDLEPLHALEVASAQADHGVSATYFFMLRNPMYNLMSLNCMKSIEALISMGHNIALHFDVSFYGDISGECLVERISEELMTLHRIAGPSNTSKCVSFHKPNKYLLENEVATPLFFSAYNRTFFKDIRYIADSCGNWREQSIIELIKSQLEPKIQFTSHPIWWTMKGATVGDRLQAYLKLRRHALETDLANTSNDTSRGIILHEPPSPLE